MTRAEGTTRSAALHFDHVAITVADMDRSVAFYRDLLGCVVLGQLVLDEGRFKLVYLRRCNAYLELFAHEPPAESAPGASDDAPRLGFQHVAFQTDDVDAAAAALRAAGVHFTDGPRDAPGGVRLAFFHDPDGNLVELVSNLPELAPYRPDGG
ncbi:MAG: VOC family protein [Deinococcales bacterium]